jgi:LacI family transcriptional regulator
MRAMFEHCVSPNCLNLLCYSFPMNPDHKPRRAARNRRTVTTIREIAALADVSTATVSRVINQPETVKESTRDRVLSVMKKNHFVLDKVAGGLKSQRTRTIGLIIPTIANSIYSSSTQAIQRVAQAEGYTVFVGISEFSAAGEAELIHRLIEHRIDGLILTGADRAADVYAKVMHNKIPFVVTWQLSRSDKLPSVSFDNYNAARTATNHLLSLGHRNIGLICGKTALNDRAFERRRAFEDVLNEHGLVPRPECMHEREFEMAEGREAMALMLATNDPPSAVFCANDVQAVGAIAACGDRNLRVPEDVSIIGFDDLPIAQCTIPPLTTVRVPAYDMGTRAVRELISAIRNKRTVTPHELPTTLVVRNSTSRFVSNLAN